MSLIIAQYSNRGVIIAADGRSTFCENGQYVLHDDAYRKIVDIGDYIIAGGGPNFFHGYNLAEIVREVFNSKHPADALEFLKALRTRTRDTNAVFWALNKQNGNLWRTNGDDIIYSDRESCQPLGY